MKMGGVFEEIRGKKAWNMEHGTWNRRLLFPSSVKVLE
jgi:hypothetical protein